MKKVISVVLATMVLLSGFTVMAQTAPLTEELEMSGYIPAILFDSGDQNADHSLEDSDFSYFGNLSDAQVISLTNALYNCIVNMNLNVNIYNYGIILDDITVLDNVFNQMLQTYPELINVRGYLFSYAGNTIYDFYPAYIDSYISAGDNYYNGDVTDYVPLRDVYAEHIAYCDDETDRIISLMEPDFSDLEKVLWIHDYIVNNFEYDRRLYAGHTEPGDTVYDMYGFLTQHKGVCQAYAYTFMYIMRRLGIECACASHLSDINHIWNLVKLNGEYYHIDCTQDDPLYKNPNADIGQSDARGIVNHTYTLLNDAEIKATGDVHASWYSVPTYKDITSTSTAFSGASFQKAVTALCYYDGFWYTATTLSLPTDIERYDRDFNYSGAKARIDTIYSAGNVGIRGMTVVGNCLYVNGYYGMYKYNIDKNQLTTEIVMPGQIRSCYYMGNGYVGYVAGDDLLNTADNKIKLNIGDVNDDGGVDSYDLTAVRRYIVGDTLQNFNTVFADCDFDGSITLVDFVKLKKRLAGYTTF